MHPWRRTLKGNMSLQLLFWVIYIVSVIFGLYSNWPDSRANARPFGNALIVFILIGILGWSVFGAAIHR
jgi:hypothetical protein